MASPAEAAFKNVLRVETNIVIALLQYTPATPGAHPSFPIDLLCHEWAGFKGLKNGELLREAENVGYDASS
jgi:hypothetical protein